MTHVLPILAVRKRPVEVEAVLVTKNHERLEKIKEWISTSGRVARIDTEKCLVYIETLEGIMYAGEGDYIIKGVAGEFYPCKPDIFEKTYQVI